MGKISSRVGYNVTSLNTSSHQWWINEMNIVARVRAEEVFCRKQILGLRIHEDSANGAEEYDFTTRFSMEIQEP